MHVCPLNNGTFKLKLELHNGGSTPMSKKAGVIGATGEVGHHLVSQLIKSGEYSQVTVFSRRKIDIETTNPDILVIVAATVLPLNWLL